MNTIINYALVNVEGYFYSLVRNEENKTYSIYLTDNFGETTGFAKLDEAKEIQQKLIELGNPVKIIKVTFEEIEDVRKELKLNEN